MITIAGAAEPDKRFEICQFCIPRQLFPSIDDFQTLPYLRISSLPGFTMCCVHIWREGSNGSHFRGEHLTFVPRRSSHCLNSSFLLNPHVYIRQNWVHILIRSVSTDGNEKRKAGILYTLRRSGRRFPGLISISESFLTLERFRAVQSRSFCKSQMISSDSPWFRDILMKVGMNKTGTRFYFVGRKWAEGLYMLSFPTPLLVTAS